jgi:hypothetical protein
VRLAPEMCGQPLESFAVRFAHAVASAERRAPFI